jgi:uncharacterized protein (DUF58 family)
LTSKSWLLPFFVLLVAGAVLRQGLLFLFAAASLLTALTSWLWQRYCFHGVTYRRVLSQHRAFFDEEIDLVLEVVNRKLLPLPWLEVKDEVPESLTYLSAHVTASYKPKRKTLVHLCSPKWYERIRRRYRIRCTQRGLHEFGPATLRAGDLFGFSFHRRDAIEVDRLIVYPKIVPLDRLGLPTQGPFGELVTPRTLWEDPTHLAGVRAYQLGDPLRRIHWKASARLGNLQAKLIEPTTHPRLAVFLDMHTLSGHPWWAGYDPLIVELSVIVATSIVAWAVESKLPVGLYINGYRFRGEGATTITLPPSEHPEQLHAILEALATVMPVAQLSLGELVAIEAPALPWGTTVLAITAVPDEDLLGALNTLRTSGRSVGLVLVGTKTQAISTDGVSVFRVMGEEAWREIVRVSLD